ncbi:hypothetical protein [Cellulomonas sp. Y8]|uniref:hypothetical protein n=1 Tax=Cellulomonas sp. Y8 TaxID=2591145 RepID=UPI003D764C24
MTAGAWSLAHLVLTATPSPSPSPSTSGATSPGTGADFVSGAGFLAFAFGAFLVVAGTYVLLRLRGKEGPVTLVRVMALMFVVVAAVVLAFGSVASETKTAAFTVLGTIAGYLAASRTPGTTKTVRDTTTGVETTTRRDVT